MSSRNRNRWTSSRAHPETLFYFIFQIEKLFTNKKARLIIINNHSYLDSSVGGCCLRFSLRWRPCRRLCRCEPLCRTRRRRQTGRWTRLGCPIKTECAVRASKSVSSTFRPIWNVFLINNKWWLLKAIEYTRNCPEQWSLFTALLGLNGTRR